MANNIPGKVDTLPGPYSIYGDGNLGRLAASANPPRIAMFGTAGSGNDYAPQAFTEDTIDSMQKIFGTEGNMMAQIQEGQGKGLQSALAIRIGARPSFVMHIGADTGQDATDQEYGFWVESFFGGKEFGTRFGMAWDKASNRLIVEDKANSIVIFDNSTTAPIDQGLLIVRGQGYTTSTQDSIGTISPLATVAFNSIDVASPNDLRALYAGEDGTSLSRMELFEGVMKGFAALEGFNYDYLPLPSDASLDAPYKVQSVTAAVGTAYPTRNNNVDQLGKVYIEFVDDKYEFYWDVDNDGVAEYWSVADTSGYSGTSKGGKVFASSDFLEPNFGYALAYHCHRTTYEESFVQGIVGVEAPRPRDRFSKWIGTKPTYSTAVDGAVTVSQNGTLLLGNKYLAGATGHRAGKAYGGFIETSEPYFDSGTEQSDVNGRPVDMGRYLSLWITPETHQPSLGVNNNRAYNSISPIAYAAFRERLAVDQSPTNKTYNATRGILTARLNRSQQADLMDTRYTFAKEDNLGVRVVDGPTAARPDSDYTRQGTIEIVQFVDEVLRTVADGFIGRNVTAQEELALQKELEEAMNGLIGTRVIRNGVAKLVISPQDRILGQANVQVTIEAPFEIQRIVFTVNLRRSA